MSRPLDGVLVLDLSRAVAGPYCTMLLGDLGARVIKVEEAGGDEARGWGPPFAGEISTYFCGINRNKESAIANLKSEAGRDFVARIARRADVVVENFRPGVAQRLGVDYESLRALQPSLIYGSVSGFGQEGPDKDRPGYDLVVQAASGLMYTSGQPDGGPGKVSFPIADVMAAMFLHQAILAALFRRNRTGEGAYLDTTLIDSLLAGMFPLTAAHLIGGIDPKPPGAAHANIVPYQIFTCREGQVAVAVSNERIWRRLASLLGGERWLSDPRFAANADRNRNRIALLAEMEPLFAAETAMYWEARLRGAEVPCAAVRTVGEALNLDAVRSIVSLDDGMRVFGNPVRISGHDIPAKAVPAAGADTTRLWREFAEAARG